MPFILFVISLDVLKKISDIKSKLNQSKIKLNNRGKIKFKVTVYLQIDNFLQIWIFGSKYWSKCDPLTF